MADDSGEIVREAAESVAFENVKVGGGGPSFYANLAMANAVSNQQALNQLNMAIVSKAAEMVMSTSPTEGGVDVATLGQLMKGLSITPPPNE